MTETRVGVQHRTHLATGATAVGWSNLCQLRVIKQITVSATCTPLGFEILGRNNLAKLSSDVEDALVGYPSILSD